jgi:hypothetical protein
MSFLLNLNNSTYEYLSKELPQQLPERNLQVR